MVKNKTNQNMNGLYFRSLTFIYVFTMLYKHKTACGNSPSSTDRHDIDIQAHRSSADETGARDIEKNEKGVESGKEEKVDRPNGLAEQMEAQTGPFNFKPPSANCHSSNHTYRHRKRSADDNRKRTNTPQFYSNVDMRKPMAVNTSLEINCTANLGFISWLSIVLVPGLSAPGQKREPHYWRVNRRMDCVFTWDEFSLLCYRDPKKKGTVRTTVSLGVRVKEKHDGLRIICFSHYQLNRSDLWDSSDRERNETGPIKIHYPPKLRVRYHGKPYLVDGSVLQATCKAWPHNNNPIVWQLLLASKNTRTWSVYVTGAVARQPDLDKANITVSQGWTNRSSLVTTFTMDAGHSLEGAVLICANNFDDIHFGLGAKSKPFRIKYEPQPPLMEISYHGEEGHLDPNEMIKASCSALVGNDGSLAWELTHERGRSRWSMDSNCIHSMSGTPWKGAEILCRIDNTEHGPYITSNFSETVSLSLNQATLACFSHESIEAAISTVFNVTFKPRKFDASQAIAVAMSTMWFAVLFFCVCTACYVSNKSTKETVGDSVSSMPTSHGAGLKNILRAPPNSTVQTKSKTTEDDEEDNANTESSGETGEKRPTSSGEKIERISHHTSAV